MFKITDDNYDFYKQICETLWIFKSTRLLNRNPNVEHSPVTILNSWEKKSKSIAKRGLKESLRDMLTMLLDLPTTMKTELSELLIKKGLPSFNQLISTIKDTPQKVLKRDKIKDLDEYYVIKEFLDDLTSEISNADRQQLEKILVTLKTITTRRKTPANN